MQPFRPGQIENDFQPNILFSIDAGEGQLEYRRIWSRLTWWEGVGEGIQKERNANLESGIALSPAKICLVGEVTSTPKEVAGVSAVAFIRVRRRGRELRQLFFRGVGVFQGVSIFVM